jgi:hypothetical protein
MKVAGSHESEPGACRVLDHHGDPADFLFLSISAKMVIKYLIYPTRIILQNGRGVPVLPGRAGY